MNINGVPHDQPADPFQSNYDSVIVSTDANPSPGLSRVCPEPLFSDTQITERALLRLLRARPRVTSQLQRAFLGQPSVQVHFSRERLFYRL